MNLKLACATDDGKTYVDEHFGEAKFYDIYTISKEGYEYIKRIENTTDEEDDENEMHGDPRKAKGISEILKEEDGISVLVSRQFGLNIKRMKKKFVPVIVRTEKIEDGLNIVKNNIDIIIAEKEKGENRNHIILG